MSRDRRRRRRRRGALPLLARWSRLALARLPPVVPLVLLSVSIVLDVLSSVTALLAGSEYRPESSQLDHRTTRFPGLLRVLSYVSLSVVAMSRLRLWWRDVRVEVHGIIIKSGKACDGGDVKGSSRRRSGSHLSDDELTADDYELCRERYKYTPWPPPEMLGWAPFG
ncbi:putative ATP-dependent RNA helicase ddx43, partial [Perkinsus olseni]